jgi:hypothetical protein
MLANLVIKIVEVLSAGYGRGNPQHAIRLTNLSSYLATRGQPWTAMAAAEGAVRIYEHLADYHPRKFLPRLAASLVTQSTRQASLGDEQKRAAIASARRAVQIYRGLFKKYPYEFSTALMESLEVQYTYWSDLGYYKEAKLAKKEANQVRQMVIKSQKSSRPEDRSRNFTSATAEPRPFIVYDFTEGGDGSDSERDCPPGS